MGIRLFASIFAALLGSTAVHGSPGPPGSAACPVSRQLARLTRDSDVIVIARPLTPLEELRSAIAESSPRYLEMSLADVSVLKGAAGSSNPVVKFFAADRPYTPKLQLFLDRAGKQSVLFMTRVDERNGGLYVSDSPGALRPLTPSLVAEIEAELGRQKQILERWRADPTMPHFAQIRRLLAQLPMASRERQAAIFEKLEKLGEPAVPALIAQMDDRRPLAHQEISLVNDAPDAFEGIRHYGPKLVVDALDAILNQIAGYGGSIANGGSERQRRAAVAAWRIYDADRACPTG